MPELRKQSSESNRSYRRMLSKLSLGKSWNQVAWEKYWATVWRELWSLVSCWCLWSCHFLVTTKIITQELQDSESFSNLEEAPAIAKLQLVGPSAKKENGSQSMVGTRNWDNLSWLREIQIAKPSRKKFCGFTLRNSLKMEWLNPLNLFQVGMISTLPFGHKIHIVLGL